MADVFISYSSEDRNRVRPLAEALQSRGFNVWWDRALGAGQDYTAVIEAELQAAKAVIVVWTQGSAASTFVRDEAGRARDEGRLVPVLLDKVNIPLGFGSFQAEDFTRWNGGADAPQMQILEEALKAKIEGRSIDGGAVARKRRRLMQRIRLVSVLTVIFLVVGIAVGVNTLFKPDPPEVQQADLRAQLLQLLAEGKLTPEQAIQLAQILESGALGDVATDQVAVNDDQTNGAATQPAPSTMARNEDGSPIVAEASLTMVSEAEFNSDARETYRTAMGALLRSSDPQVRQAAGQLGNPATRDSAIQTLWAKAQAGDPLAAQIYQVCGAVGTANDNPIGARALEASATMAPTNRQAWRMLSYSYRQRSQERQADAAALVASAADAGAQGQTEVAEQRLQEALPNLPTGGQAVVASQLGAIAEQRQDWNAASARLAEAYRLREQVAQSAPASAPAQESLQLDAQRLVVALDRSGRTRQACERLQQAQEEHAVESPDASLEQRCRVQFRVQVAPAVQLRQRSAVTQQTAPAPTQQIAPVQRVAPSP